VPRRRCRSHRPPQRPVGRAMAEPSRAVTHARGAVVTGAGHAEEQRQPDLDQQRRQPLPSQLSWFAAGSSEQYWDEGNLDCALNCRRRSPQARVSPSRS